MHSSRCASIFWPSRAAKVAAVAPPSASCASSSDRPETFPAEPEAAAPAVPARPAGGETKEEESACSGNGTTKSPP